MLIVFINSIKSSSALVDSDCFSDCASPRLRLFKISNCVLRIFLALTSSYVSSFSSLAPILHLNHIL